MFLKGRQKCIDSNGGSSDEDLGGVETIIRIYYMKNTILRIKTNVSLNLKISLKHFRNHIFTGQWWHTPVIPAIGRQSQADLSI